MVTGRREPASGAGRTRVRRRRRTHVGAHAAARPYSGAAAQRLCARAGAHAPRAAPARHPALSAALDLHRHGAQRQADRRPGLLQAHAHRQQALVAIKQLGRHAFGGRLDQLEGALTQQPLDLMAHRPIVDRGVQVVMGAGGGEVGEQRQRDDELLPERVLLRVDPVGWRTPRAPRSRCGPRRKGRAHPRGRFGGAHPAPRRSSAPRQRPRWA